MTTDKFITNKLALTTLIAACLVVLISLSVRQVFGMFFMDFNIDLGISNTEFGLAIGIQMLGWGLSGPIFGAIADKYGGHKAIMLAFIFYILGVYFFICWSKYRSIFSNKFRGINWYRLWRYSNKYPHVNCWKTFPSFK